MPSYLQSARRVGRVDHGVQDIPTNLDLWSSLTHRRVMSYWDVTDVEAVGGTLTSVRLADTSEATGSTVVIGSTQGTTSQGVYGIGRAFTLLATFDQHFDMDNAPWVRGASRSVGEIRIHHASPAQGDLETPSPAELVRHIRDTAGLTAEELAQVVGVSRRTLYHWLAGGSPAPENWRRVVSFADLIRPMANRWGPARTAAWLIHDQAVIERLPFPDDPAVLGELVDEALAADEIPMISVGPASEAGSITDVEEIAPLSSSELSHALTVFRQPRAVVGTEEWSPRELAFGDPETDDE